MAQPSTSPHPLVFTERITKPTHNVGDSNYGVTEGGVNSYGLPVLIIIVALNLSCYPSYPPIVSRVVQLVVKKQGKCGKNTT